MNIVVDFCDWNAECFRNFGKGQQFIVFEQRINSLLSTHDRQFTRREHVWAILERVAQLAVGDTLDNRYIIDRPIARGGMATVYRCVDTRLGREVAAKVMHESYVHDSVFRERFRREARAMAQLSHPNLVNVYDFAAQGEPTNQVFLIMELITGGTLRELLAERGPMPPHAAAEVMRAVLTGLAVAHQKGMVHRDIKPDNILINSDHSVKLADFGLVRAVSDITHSTDQIVGTVAYLSPEQVDGSPITQASDVYSAGIVLFELLTGQQPFNGDTPIAHAFARLHDVVPAPSSRIGGVPKLFDELVATATATDPHDRFHDASEFLAALNDVADALELPPYAVPVPRHSAANRAAAHPTQFRLRPNSTDDSPRTRVDAPTVQPPAPAPPPPQVPAPAPPQAPLSPARPRKPVSNRSGIGLAVFLVFSAICTGLVAVGGWWLGSGMYGEIPQILLPMP